MKSYLSIVLLTATASVLGEQLQTVQDGITVDVTVEPTSITVGDPVTLQIVAKTQDNTQLELLNKESFGSFVVTEESNLLDIPNGNNREWTWSMQLDTFDAETDTLSGIEIKWSNVHGASGMIEIEPIPVQVHSVAGEALQEMELRDIKPSVPLLSKSWWTLIVIFILAMIGCGWIYRVHKNRKMPTIPPDVKAMQAIEALRDSDVDVITFYTNLSNIVRMYIEEQLHIATTGQTTREFLIAEKENPRFEHKDRKALSDFLVAADLVKFAKFEPSELLWDDAIKHAQEFVTNTVQSTNQVTVEVAA